MTEEKMELKELEKVIEYFVNNLSKESLQDTVYEQYVNILYDDTELLINIIEADSKKTVEELLKESTKGIKEGGDD